jgi:pimeloyl-ACP methyl ester carboxylesterase
MNTISTFQGMAAACMLALAAGASPASDEPAVSRPIWTNAVVRVTSLAEAADQRLRRASAWGSAYIHRQAASAPRMRGMRILSVADGVGAQVESDLTWVTLDGLLPQRVVVLIHGLDEPGRVWDDLAPALHRAGLTVVRFDYPNDGPIADSADLLATALRELRTRGITHVNLIGHSMGGLVARDALTRAEHYAGVASGHDDLPDVPRLITLGTPHDGSPWARLQCISETAEQVDRYINDPGNPRHLLGFLADGRGEAARDLRPGSAFLTDLNARPVPTGVAITCIVAVIGPPAQSDAPGDEPNDEGSRSAADSSQGCWRTAHLAAAAQRLGERLGDGVVSTASAALPSAEVVHVRASHRGMVRDSKLEGAVRWTLGAAQDAPVAIPIILERLEKPGAANAPAERQPR